MKNELFTMFDRVSVSERLATQLEESEVLSCRLYQNENRVEVTISCNGFPSRTELAAYCRAIAQVYGLNSVEIHLNYINTELTADYFRELTELFMEQHPACRSALMTAEFSPEYGELLVHGISGGESLLRDRRYAEFLADRAREELGTEITVRLQINEIDTAEVIRTWDKEQRELVQKAAAERPVSLPGKKSAALTSGTLFGKPIGAQDSMPIIDLQEGMSDCIITGEVLSVDSRDFTGKSPRNGREYSSTTITFGVGDGEWACTCKLHGGAERLAAAKKGVSVGARVRLRGDYTVDEYARKLLFTVKSLELLPAKPVREDTAEEKRVELHLHTKMSALDAVSSAKDLIHRAAAWGHKAIAITDHGVAQAFPEAHLAAQDVRKAGNEDFKVIYGMEGYLVDDGDSPLRTLAAAPPDTTYVVFDIETTGLNPISDQITEIGAVKIVNGEKTEAFSELIHPGIPIPPRIVELTGITDAMVADKPGIDEILPKFLDFCKDATVVAHNASFDTGFIRQKAGERGLTFDRPVIDTLRLSREVFPGERRHSLGVLAERMGVSLENHHRAIDDAGATADIFLQFLKTAREQCGETEPNIDTNPELLKNPSYHIILLAQNYTGLKNLYRIISASNLNYFYKRPRIPRSLIRKYRAGILLGSACEAGELYRAIEEGKPKEELTRIASFYDYLEIQPLGNNRFKLRSGTVADETALQNINRTILELGDSLRIPTVATCDVHFMDPEDAVYRRVLQGAQGYTDADEQAPLYFRTTDEMLAEFAYLGEKRAKEVVIDNPNRIADMIEAIQPVKDGSYPPSIENCEQDLENLCHEKAHRIYGDVLPPVVQERMDKELNSIIGNGYAVMYIIAHKLVKKSNDAGYMVGSRGSVGSSFAAFLADITEVNALCPHYICPNPECKHSEFFEHGEYAVGPDMPDKVCPKCGTPMKKDGLTIPFETFLGFKGDKVPDIDLNFSGEYQATAHKYVGELFGEEYVFKAGTIGTIAEKTATGFYARKYFENKGITDVPEPVLQMMSRGLIDVKRTTGQHPGGIIVCPKTMDIHDFCPVQHPADKKDSDVITTHFDFHSIHDNLLKLDILGHDDPSTIRMLEDLTGLDAKELPLDDKKVMSLFSSTEALGVTPEQIGSELGTFGIPEFGTGFVQGMLLETRPTTFFELLIISGLSHGTDVWLNNAQDLIKSKKATLSEVIGLRDDIMIYLIRNGLESGMAFQIMEYVRKGKAAKSGMPPEYEEAIRAQSTIPDWYLESCKKIKYMFPKAHAAAYVTMALRIAYFKVYYPVEFYIAYFTVRADLFDAALMAKGEEKVKNEIRKLRMQGNNISANEKSLLTILELCLEMYARGITFQTADLYRSHSHKFIKVDDHTILPPLNAFSGVGDAAAEGIYRAAKDGKFLSEEDLQARSGANKSVLEILRENGVLADLPQSSQMDFFGSLL